MTEPHPAPAPAASYVPPDQAAPPAPPHPLAPPSLTPHSLAPQPVVPQSAPSQSTGPHPVAPQPIGPHPVAPQAVGPQAVSPQPLPLRQAPPWSAAQPWDPATPPHPLASATQPQLIPGPPVAARRRRSVLTGFLLTLLIIAVGAQSYWIYQLSERLTDAQAQSAWERQAANESAEAMANRVTELENAAFQPDQIAKNALQSVFRVRAAQFSGTAWAVGKPASGGGANLFTNYHVIEVVWVKGGDRQVTIEHNDKQYAARIVNVDKDKDVAQLQTDEKFPGLSVSRAQVNPGEQVVVVGAPLGLESSVTTGVVSAFRRLEAGGEPYVQFDAPINPGNSGGPVINARGQVVGIATAKLRNAEGIGLAVPIDKACTLFPICD